jgi:hypothetical protein
MRQAVSHAPAAPATTAPPEPEPMPTPLAPDAGGAAPEPAVASGWPRAPRRPPTSRYTIDLELHHRAALRDRARDLDVSASAIVRALLDLVENDPALAARLADAVGPQP